MSTAAGPSVTSKVGLCRGKRVMTERDAGVAIAEGWGWLTPCLAPVDTLIPQAAWTHDELEQLIQRHVAVGNRWVSPRQRVALPSAMRARVLLRAGMTRERDDLLAQLAA
jgi:hypothetical protein